MKSVYVLFRRDFKKAMNLRAWVIWLVLAAVGVFFFFTSGGKTKLIANNQVEFIALFLPHMIFGSWAILSVYFDLISSDREHNVMDCILCSGISKSKIFVAKILVIAVMSLVLAMIYLIPVTCFIIGLSKDWSHILVLFLYLLPLWGYIMVFAAVGIFISVLARSSKAALIWSLAIGLLLMPRLFVMLLEGIGQIAGWSTETINKMSLIAPGVMMQALSDVSDKSYFGIATIVFSVSILFFWSLAYLVFRRQDELNYGE
ncbi:MAG TPA: ABC transporter permease subunit [Lachnospiraceae bacterium]|nr:ABC transporter permease subunit [Lachnospiraceae bacterium]